MLGRFAGNRPKMDGVTEKEELEVEIGAQLSGVNLTGLGANPYRDSNLAHWLRASDVANTGPKSGQVRATPRGGLGSI